MNPIKKNYNKNFKKILIIQEKSELDYIEKNEDKFKKYKKIIWFPTNFIDERTLKYIYADNFVNKNTKFHFDTLIDSKLSFFFEKVDQIIKSEISKIPKYINIFQNSKHDCKNYFDYYFNEFAKIECLIKNFQFKYIYIFSKKKTLFSTRLESIFKYFINSKIKVIRINMNHSNLNNINFYLDSMFEPYFFKKNNILKNKIRSYLKNIYVNKWSFQKNKILLIDANKDLLQNIAKIKSKKFKFINLQNIFFNKKDLKFSNDQTLKINSRIYRLKKYLNFLPKSKNFNYEYFFLDFVINNYKNLTSMTFDIFKFISKFDATHNFRLAIAQNELFYTNIIHDFFINKKKKYLALSHGGTIGHYKTWPIVSFYNLKTNKYSYYQSFSKKMESEMRNLLKKNKKSEPYNFFEIPHFFLTKLKENIKNREEKLNLKNIVYFAAPLDGYLDSKYEVHNEFNLLKIRKNFFNNVKNYNIILRIGYKSHINQLYKKFVNQNFKKIKIASDNLPINKLFEEADIIVCEGNSSVIIEALTVNKPIILFQRNYPSFTKATNELIKKRVIIYKNVKKIVALTKNFKSLNLESIDIYDNRLINKFYNYDSINSKIIIDRLENFLS